MCDWSRPCVPLFDHDFVNRVTLPRRTQRRETNWLLDTDQSHRSALLTGVWYGRHGSNPWPSCGQVIASRTATTVAYTNLLHGIPFCHVLTILHVFPYVNCRPAAPPPQLPSVPSLPRSSSTPGLRPSVPPSHTNCASSLTTTHNLAPDLAIPRERRVIARWCRWRWRRTPVRPLGRLLLFRAGSRQHPALQGLSNRFRTDFGQISNRFHVHRITFLENPWVAWNIQTVAPTRRNKFRTASECLWRQR